MIAIAKSQSEWSDCLDRMMRQAKTAVNASRESDWKKKTQTWATSLRQREKQMDRASEKALRSHGTRRAKWGSVILTTWEQCTRSIMAKMSNQRTRNRRSEWDAWADGKVSITGNRLLYGCSA